MKINTLTAGEFIDKLEQDRNLLIVDLRTHAEVANEHLENCVHIPVQDLNEERLQQAMKDNGFTDQHSVFLLCQSGKRAQMAADKLSHVEDLSLVILEGGLNAIKQEGVKVKSGKSNVISLERQVRISAGVLTMLGIALGFTLHPGFFLLSGFVGAGLTFAGITDNCAMGLMLARMPWNARA